MKLQRFFLGVCLLPAGLSGVLCAQDSPTAQPPLSNADMLKYFREALPFDIHGGVLYWHYQPLVKGFDSNSEIYYANLLIDVPFESFGYHFEPRFRDTKLRPFFESNIWIQENYLSWRPCGKDGGVLKAGKIYSQFGRSWDGVFYGNIPYFDGLKLDPDIGVSWEQRVALGEKSAVDYSLQYFSQDGATNGSLQGRDTLSIGMQRNIVVARVAPTFQLGSDTSATIGVSGMHFEAELSAPASDSRVTRENVEASLTTGLFTVFGEVTHQEGNHVVNFPLPGSTSDDIDYVMSGVSYKWDDVTFRYSYSLGNYKEDNVREELHLPGIEYRINKNLSVWLEYVYWNRDTAGHDVIQDRSLNLILYGSF